MNKFIYFDNASSTKISNNVNKKIFFFNKTKYINFYSKNFLGKILRNYINNCVKNISFFFKSKKKEIFFTQSSSFSNNILLKILNKKNILLSKVEHISILKNIKQKKYLKVNKKGLIKYTFDFNTLILTYFNNETGVFQNFNKILKICLFKKIITLIDLTTSNYFNSFIKSDIIIFSSHKIHGPKGISGIFINKNIVNIFKNINFFIGTIPTNQIVGITYAFKYFKTYTKKITNISNCLIIEIYKKKAYINGDIYNKHFSIINFGFKNLINKINKNIIYSTKSSCYKKTSYVLKEMKKYNKSIRLSFSKYNSIKELLFLNRYFF
ncbi:aminotransferase class V-fold PLP-dependent enzyme [Candidatus Vidania fulgoroideorum]